MDRIVSLYRQTDGPHRFVRGGLNHQKVAMAERWLSVDEIAAHLGVNPDTIYKWITRKKMPGHKVGRLWKFLASEVDAWVKGGHAREDVSADTPDNAARKKARES